MHNPAPLSEEKKGGDEKCCQLTQEATSPGSEVTKEPPPSTYYGLLNLAEERREMLSYFLQCFERGNMQITGLDVTKLKRLCGPQPKSEPMKPDKPTEPTPLTLEWIVDGWKKRAIHFRERCLTVTANELTSCISQIERFLSQPPPWQRLSETCLPDISKDLYLYSITLEKVIRVDGGQYESSSDVIGFYSHWLYATAPYAVPPPPREEKASDGFEEYFDSLIPFENAKPIPDGYREELHSCWKAAQLESRKDK